MAAIRVAGPSDAEGIAALHAESWRRHYRGLYSDAFLDGDVRADRLEVWTRRLGAKDAASRTFVAKQGDELIGFAHVAFDDDATWGALLDNLHVAQGRKRQGVGSALLTACAGAVAERGTGLYLWVLEQNIEAKAFYEAHGAERVGEAPASPPGGVAGRLAGSPVKLRYAWSDPGSVWSRRSARFS